MKIKLRDLQRNLCKSYLYLYLKYEIDEEFNPLEEIHKTNPYGFDSDVAWLIKNCQPFKEWYEKQHSELVK